MSARTPDMFFANILELWKLHLANVIIFSLELTERKFIFSILMYVYLSSGFWKKCDPQFRAE